MKFSGSSGIRMVWSEELLKMAYQLGICIGNNFDEVVVASDFRDTSDALLSILAGGIMSGGADVYYGGNVPTPTLAYGAKNHDLGVMITASHNPPEYNGIKLWNPDGSAFTDTQLSKLQGRKIGAWERVGKWKEENLLNIHREALLKQFKELNMKVVIDCSNGAGSVLTPFVFRELGAEVTTLNCHPSGKFPGHGSEPGEKDLKMLKALVLKKRADLGIAHDGDADRFVAITSSGRYLSGDELLALFVKLLGFKRIVAPVDSSMLLDNFAEVIRCKVGDANVSATMKEQGVEFGGENSGTQIFAAWRYTPDAIYSALKFAELAMSVNVDELVDSFPRYYTLRKSIYYEDQESMRRKIERLVENYEVERVDGYRVSLDDGWFLIRFSGTEPKVRITVEFENKEKAEEILNKIVREMK